MPTDSPSPAAPHSQFLEAFPCAAAFHPRRRAHPPSQKGTRPQPRHGPPPLAMRAAGMDMDLDVGVGADGALATSHGNAPVHPPPPSTPKAQPGSETGCPQLAGKGPRLALPPDLLSEAFELSPMRVPCVPLPAPASAPALAHFLLPRFGTPPASAYAVPPPLRPLLQEPATPGAARLTSFTRPSSPPPACCSLALLPACLALAFALHGLMNTWAPALAACMTREQFDQDYAAQVEALARGQGRSVSTHLHPAQHPAPCTLQPSAVAQVQSDLKAIGKGGPDISGHKICLYTVNNVVAPIGGHSALAEDNPTFAACLELNWKYWPC
eukprot:gene2807-3418_t